jgi:hypothetical protein
MVQNKSYEIRGIRVWEYSAEAPVLSTAREAIALIGDAMACGAKIVIVPASCLAPEFFHLRTGFAGEVLQKFVTYGLRVTIIGDVSTFSSNSNALRDLIRESNRGTNAWFLADMDELSARLEA